MTDSQLQDFIVFRNSLPLPDSDSFISDLQSHCKHRTLKKNEKLICYQESNADLFFIVSGSFIRSIITASGNEKTIMFHTESFNEYIKAYDTAFTNEKTSYEVKANENSTVIAIDFNFVYSYTQQNLLLLQYYTQKVEALFSLSDLFRNLQLAMTSEEYLKWLYENYSFLFQRFPATNLASFIGITPVWLSRLKVKISS